MMEEFRASDKAVEQWILEDELSDYIQDNTDWDLYNKERRLMKGVSYEKF